MEKPEIRFYNPNKHSRAGRLFDEAVSQWEKIIGRKITVSKEKHNLQIFEDTLKNPEVSGFSTAPLISLDNLLLEIDKLAEKDGSISYFVLPEGWEGELGGLRSDEGNYGVFRHFNGENGYIGIVSEGTPDPLLFHVMLHEGGHAFPAPPKYLISPEGKEYNRKRIISNRKGTHCTTPGCVMQERDETRDVFGNPKNSLNFALDVYHRAKDGEIVYCGLCQEDIRRHFDV